MHITVIPMDNEGVVLLRLEGEFDSYYTERFNNEVDLAAKALEARGDSNNSPTVLVGLRQVKYINSTALGALIKCKKRLEGKGIRFVIIEPSAYARKMIENVGVGRVVDVFDTREAALAK